MAVTKAELPRYFDKGAWRRVPIYTNVQRRDVLEPCALCGWGKDMAIHCKPEGAPPVGPLGLHGWVSKNTPNVEWSCRPGTPGLSALCEVFGINLEKQACKR